ncbi:hypothetical protein [Microbacterium sp.]|uniref:hypothetical protein n=1 Tax=Microbacterium sp. TaxID=51671 RepID=UPI003C74EB4A
MHIEHRRPERVSERPEVRLPPQRQLGRLVIVQLSHEPERLRPRRRAMPARRMRRAHPLAGNITGADLVIDGGLTTQP